jgi:hypothetical protein
VIRAAVARGMGLAAAEAAQRKNFPDCSRCNKPENHQLREFWGCDSPSDAPVWVSTCHRCSGSDPLCQLCEGSDRITHHRCPSSIVNGAPTPMKIHLDLLMRAWRQYHTHGIFPVEGAYLDQSRSFLAAADLMDSENTFWELSIRDEQRAKAESERRRSEASRTVRRR